MFDKGMKLFKKEQLMRMAMAEAEMAMCEGNSPFGAVLCDVEGHVLTRAHNTTVTDTDPTAHAEINALRLAGKKLGKKDLRGLVLVSNAQSCPMCFCAAIRSGVVEFVYGYAEDETLVPKISVFSLAQFCAVSPNIETGVLGDECEKQLKEMRKNAAGCRGMI